MGGWWCHHSLHFINSEIKFCISLIPVDGWLGLDMVVSGWRFFCEMVAGLIRAVKSNGSIDSVEWKTYVRTRYCIWACYIFSTPLGMSYLAEYFSIPDEEDWSLRRSISILYMCYVFDTTHHEWFAKWTATRIAGCLSKRWPTKSKIEGSGRKRGWRWSQTCNNISESKLPMENPQSKGLRATASPVRAMDPNLACTVLWTLFFFLFCTL